LVGMLRGQVSSTPLADVVGKTKPILPELFELQRILDL